MRHAHRIVPGISAAIGQTPPIRLYRASQETGCTILGKAEFLNPELSVKDRAALAIVNNAERRGLIRPSGTIVEGTAGNTGIGLALVAAVPGYRTVIVIPETQSIENKQALRHAGACLVEVPAAPYANPNTYVHAARRLAERLAATGPAGACFADQFDNVANRRAHEEGTGPEIFDATDGGVDGFVCAVGTGGTLAGVARALRAESRGHHRLGRSRRLGAPCPFHDRNSQGRGLVDHRRHRPRADHAEPRGLRARSVVPHRRCGSFEPHL